VAGDKRRLLEVVIRERACITFHAASDVFAFVWCHAVGPPVQGHGSLQGPKQLSRNGALSMPAFLEAGLHL
jgi:hypothetical protein